MLKISWAWNGQANHFRLMQEGGGNSVKWLAAVQLNGEYTHAQQAEIMDAMADAFAKITAK